MKIAHFMTIMEISYEYDIRMQGHSSSNCDKLDTPFIIDSIKKLENLTATRNALIHDTSNTSNISKDISRNCIISMIIVPGFLASTKPFHELFTGRDKSFLCIA
uniref:Uncharacterized protein n=1 Tax=Glossina palpalis gambiensis TaxID=67801 RepID=A0A1B0C1K6_9MUSC